MGMVAAKAHQMGKTKSASVPSPMKQSQKIFRSISHSRRVFYFL